MRRPLALLVLPLLSLSARAQEPAGKPQEKKHQEDIDPMLDPLTGARVLFYEDFEDGAEGWTASGTPQTLWHVSAPGECGAVTRMAVYNRAPEACNYRTGGSNSGTFLSPVFTLSGEHSIVVMYDYRQETDEGPCIELVEESNGKATPVIGCSCCKDPFNSPVPVQAVGALPNPRSWAGKKVRLRLGFKADPDGNFGFGFMVDNIRVIASGPPEVLYTEDFEGNVDGWTMTTELGTLGNSLWHIANAGECGAPSRLAAYNRAPADCDYVTRGGNAGRLKGPMFTIRGAPPFTVEFASRKAMDAKVDATLLQVVETVIGTAINGGPYPDSADPKAVFLTIDPEGLWSYWSGKEAHLEFAASGDGVGNQGFGWMVDDIRVTNSGALPATPVIRGIEPERARVGESSTIVLSGEHFTEAVGVRFGPAVASFHIDSDTRITAKLEPSSLAGRVDVVVRSYGGSGWLPEGFEFAPPSAAAK